MITEIKGQWVVNRKTGQVEEDENCRHIKRLISGELKRVALDPSGWSTLYLNERTNEHWELFYPHSEMHGGGPPCLRLVEFGEDKRLAQWPRFVLEIDLKTIQTKEELLNRLAHDFQFPDYFGKNWDAFDECLSEFCSRSGSIVLKNTGAMKECLGKEIEMLSRAIEEFNKESKVKIEIERA